MKKGENIRLRQDGRYEARYEKGRNAEGKIIYGYCYGQTYEEAEEKRTHALSRQLVPRQLNLIIMGAGFLAKEVKEMANELRIFRKIDFLEDYNSNPEAIGKCTEVQKFLAEYPAGIPAVSDKALRQMWYRRLVDNGFITPTIIHPKATVPPDAEIGPGTIICAGAIISPGAKIGQCCVIYSGAIVNRNAIVPDFTFVDCGQIAGVHGIINQQTI